MGCGIAGWAATRTPRPRVVWQEKHKTSAPGGGKKEETSELILSRTVPRPWDQSFYPASGMWKKPQKHSRTETGAEDQTMSRNPRPQPDKTGALSLSYSLHLENNFLAKKKKILTVNTNTLYVICMVNGAVFFPDRVHLGGTGIWFYRY